MQKTIGTRGLACALALICSMLGATHASAVTVMLGAAKDATLFESTTGALSGGGDDGIFAGLTGQQFNGPEDARRALLQFDLSDIPAGSTINSVSLRLSVLMSAGSTPRAMTMHRVLGDWGEGSTIDPDRPNGGSGGPAVNGDATWLHRFRPSVFWTTPGGDFVSQASATTNVPSFGAATWNTSAGLVSDVQGWLANPASNFGWLIKDAENLTRTARRFGSSEHTTASSRPLLTVDYTAPPARTPGDVNNDGVVDRADVALLSAAYGATTTANNFDLGEFSGDGVVGLADLAILQRNFALTASASPAAVPEPTSVAIAFSAFLAAGIVVAGRRRRAN